MAGVKPRRKDLARSGAPLATGDKPIDKEYDYRADHTTKEAGRFSSLIPSDRLTKVGRNESSDNSQNAGQNKAPWLSFVAGHNELGNHSNNKANDDRPKDTHCIAPIPKVVCSSMKPLGRSCPLEVDQVTTGPPALRQWPVTGEKRTSAAPRPRRSGAFPLAYPPGEARLQLTKDRREIARRGHRCSLQKPLQHDISKCRSGFYRVLSLRSRQFCSRYSPQRWNWSRCW